MKRIRRFGLFFFTKIPMLILLIFWGHLPFPNRNSYDFSSAHKYDLLLSEKTEFGSEFFKNFGFIWFFQIEFLMAILLLTNMNYLLSEKADDRRILQEFWSKKQSN